MRTFEAETMTDLHKLICDRLVKSTADGLDEFNSIDVQFHNVVAEADSMEWDFDLKDLWLTPSRWTTMVRQYIDPEQFSIWLQNIDEKIGTRDRGISTLRTNSVPPKRQSNGKVTRRWGSCMLALTYKAIPQPQITLYSRTSYLGYIGALDLSVAWMMGRYVARQLGMDMKDLKFVWYNEMMQFHGFKSLAYIFNFAPDLVPYLEKRDLSPKGIAAVNARPGLLMSRKWLQKVRKQYEDDGRMYGDEKYNTFLRIIRRYHTEVRGYDFARQFESVGVNKTEEGKVKKAYAPLASCPVSQLDFEKIGLPLSRVGRKVNLAELETDDREIDEDAPIDLDELEEDDE